MRILRPLEFYEQFVTTIGARFQENSRETRTTLGDLIGGMIRLMPKEDARELDVHCALSTTRFGSQSCRAPLLLLESEQCGRLTSRP